MRFILSLPCCRLNRLKKRNGLLIAVADNGNDTAVSPIEDSKALMFLVVGVGVGGCVVDAADVVAAAVVVAVASAAAACWCSGRCCAC